MEHNLLLRLLLFALLCGIGVSGHCSPDPNTQQTFGSQNINRSKAPSDGSPKKTDPNSNKDDCEKSLETMMWVGVGAAVGGTGLIVAAPFALAGLGFTSTGVAAGSWAASMMSSAAVTNGGGVVAGGIVATLQSAGMAGIGAAGSVTLGAGGAAAGGGVAYGWLSLYEDGDEKDTNPLNNGNGNDGNDGGNDADSQKGDKKDAQDNHPKPKQYHDNSNLK
ncbi:hypothetical protein SK128_012741 [Halocaridina rubra]|uniref:Uncharacterized protein n=1 Tax=Halocaridina rubra TaxID=373956 RepID=A0AAN8WNH2_HALRR